ncbi:MAG: hypothetical protein AAF558_09600 [Verrucomicrobiota bacterium]
MNLQGAHTVITTLSAGKHVCVMSVSAVAVVAISVAVGSACGGSW